MQIEIEFTGKPPEGLETQLTEFLSTALEEGSTPSLKFQSVTRDFRALTILSVSIDKGFKEKASLSDCPVCGGVWFTVHKSGVEILKTEFSK